MFISETNRTPEPRVSAALCQASLGLEQLSASYLIEAKGFFKARKPLELQETSLRWR
jgi:hypothetical protein